jgi:drug/metabolite transporter (DMT)-like permease
LFDGCISNGQNSILINNNFLLMTFILISIFLFALNNVLWKKNLENCSVSFLVAFRASFTSLGSLSIFLYIHGFNAFQYQPSVRITLGSVFGAMGLFLMLNVIKKAPLQLLGIYNLIGIVFSALYLHYFEKISFINSAFGLSLILIGFVLYLIKNNNKKNVTSIKIIQHFYLLLMTLSFSISSLIHWKNLNIKVPALYIIANQELVVFIFALFILIRKSNLPEVKLGINKYFTKTLVMATIIFFALLFSFLGLQVANPLISSVLFLANPLLTIVFGKLFFKEKMNSYNLIAVVLIALGAFILHYQIQII